MAGQPIGHRRQARQRLRSACHFEFSEPAVTADRSHLKNLRARALNESLTCRGSQRLRSVAARVKPVVEIQKPQKETGKKRGLRRLRIACLLDSWVPTRKRGAPVLIQNAGSHLQ